MAARWTFCCWDLVLEIILGKLKLKQSEMHGKAKKRNSKGMGLGKLLARGERKEWDWEKSLHVEQKRQKTWETSMGCGGGGE